MRMPHPFNKEFTLMANVKAVTRTIKGERLPPAKVEILTNAVTIARTAARHTTLRLTDVVNGMADTAPMPPPTPDATSLHSHFRRWFNINGLRADYPTTGLIYKTHLRAVLAICTKINDGAHGAFNLVDVNPDLASTTDAEGNNLVRLGYVRHHDERPGQPRSGRIHINFERVLVAETVAQTIVHEMSHKFARTVDLATYPYVEIARGGLGDNPSRHAVADLLNSADNIATFIIQVNRNQAR